MDRNAFFREEFQTELRVTCRSLFLEDDWIRESQTLMTMLEKLFTMFSPLDQEVIMGNTFPFANGANIESTQIPLYLYLELIADVIEKKYGNDLKYRNVEEIVTKFREYSEKAIQFSNNPMFEPQKQLSNGLVNDIIKADGFIRLSTIDVGDREVISVECIETRERHRMRKDGEYEPVGHIDRIQKHQCLYEEDEIEYKEQKEKINKEIRERFKTVTGAYFIDGYLPLVLHEFQEKLKDKNIHPNILSILQTIRENRREFPQDIKGELAWMEDCQRYLRGIQKIEAEVRTKSQEEKKSEVVEETINPTPTPKPNDSQDDEKRLAVKAARKRYAEQQPFIQWAREMLGKQKRFDAIEMDDLSVEEINNLYTGFGKGKK